MKDIKLKFKKTPINKFPKRFKNTGWKDSELPTTTKVAKYVIDECLKIFDWRTSEKPRLHEYIILDNNTAFKFVAIDLLMQKEGYDEYFYMWTTKKKYRYVDYNGYKYWIIYDVLNREKIKNG